LLTLLALSAGSALLKLGSFNTVIDLAISVLKTLLVMAVVMHETSARNPTRLTSSLGFILAHDADCTDAVRLPDTRVPAGTVVAADAAATAVVRQRMVQPRASSAPGLSLRSCPFPSAAFVARKRQRPEGFERLQRVKMCLRQRSPAK
jgi:hypothetical protein